MQERFRPFSRHWHICAFPIEYKYVNIICTELLTAELVLLMILNGFSLCTANQLLLELNHNYFTTIRQVNEAADHFCGSLVLTVLLIQALFLHFGSDLLDLVAE